mmetsp:Transcript_37922/g.91022  ORF Transcript_37922/g.91022 Transcript_37922/m.91022 type:complete len:247 (-) Transcript_37922:396-1136(-)
MGRSIHAPGRSAGSSPRATLATHSANTLQNPSTAITAEGNLSVSFTICSGVKLLRGTAGNSGGGIANSPGYTTKSSAMRRDLLGSRYKDVETGDPVSIASRRIATTSWMARSSPMTLSPIHMSMAVKVASATVTTLPARTRPQRRTIASRCKYRVFSISKARCISIIRAGSRRAAANGSSALSCKASVRGSSMGSSMMKTGVCALATNSSIHGDVLSSHNDTDNNGASTRLGGMWLGSGATRLSAP